MTKTTPTRIRVKLHCQSSAELLRQVYTGFGILQQRGIIDLTLVKERSFAPGKNAVPRLKAVINDRITVMYDTADGSEIDSKALDESDFYFKRSFDEIQARNGKYSNKIIPYGLNYAVYGSNDKANLLFFWSLISASSLKSISESILLGVYSSKFLSTLLGLNCGRGIDSLENLEYLPRPDLPPKILFLSRLRNPIRVNRKSEFQNQMNIVRVDIVRKLRKEFGSLFFGGVDATEFAINNYSDCVVDSAITKKSNYLAILKNSTICIATQGISGSNGWKLSEYVANSKAIVTEKLVYQAPGHFTSPDNYLDFTDTNGCIEAVTKLIENPNIVRTQMNNNYLYFNLYQRPEILIWNSIVKSLTL